MNSPNSNSKKQLLESIRRNVNLMQMVMDRDEEEFTPEMYRYIMHADKHLSAGVKGSRSGLIPGMQQFSKEECIQFWINGDDQSITNLLTNQFHSEVEAIETAAVEVIKTMNRDQLKPHHTELIRRVELRLLRQQFCYNGNIVDINLNP